MNFSNLQALKTNPPAGYRPPRGRLYKSGIAEFFYYRPGPACPFLKSEDVGFGASSSRGFTGIIKDGKEFRLVFDVKDRVVIRRTVSDLFNDPNLKDRHATYKEVSKFFLEKPLLEANNHADQALYDASKRPDYKENYDAIVDAIVKEFGYPISSLRPIALLPFGALSKVPLASLPTTNGGNVIIERDFHGTTRFEGPTLDQLRKAGINVEFNGATFLAMERGFQVVDSTQDGTSYIFRSTFASVGEISANLFAFYAESFGANGQFRHLDPRLGIPVGDIVPPLPTGGYYEYK